jgi:hypothetical protein
MNKHTTPQAIPDVPGVDHLPHPERGARPMAGPFYRDQVDLLLRSARQIRDRAQPGRIFIAPEGVGFTIFRRAARA